MHFGIA